MPEAITKQYLNVAETYPLYDTVLISEKLDVVPQLNNDGWFTSYANAAAVGQIPFFNVRTRNVGLAYNNQDARDAMPWAFEAYSFGVTFFANALACDEHSPRDTEELCQHIFTSDIPRHASIAFMVNQDERYRAPCLVASPGYGVIGGGFAHGGQRDFNETAPQAETDREPNRSYMFSTQGTPLKSQRWPFPVPIEIPRTASISAVVTLSDYGRALLAALVGPHTQNSNAISGQETWSAYAGIQVSLYGKRLVQQRGEYHA